MTGRNPVYPQEPRFKIEACDLATIEKRIYDHTPSRVDRLRTRLRQFFCSVWGHDRVLHFAGRRVNMRCTSCGHDTPGWVVGERRPRQRYEGDARRHALVPHRLLARRRSLPR